jgi:hypothetical protein
VSPGVRVDAPGRCEWIDTLVGALTHAQGVGTLERLIPSLERAARPSGSAGWISRVVCRCLPVEGRLRGEEQFLMAVGTNEIGPDSMSSARRIV